MDKWIPVTERLPERNDMIYIPDDDNTSDFVLVTLRGQTYPHKKDVTRIGRYSYERERWMISSNNLGRVIAWMPLPKPYEG